MVLFKSVLSDSAPIIKSKDIEQGKVFDQKALIMQVLSHSKRTLIKPFPRGMVFERIQEFHVTRT